MALEAMHSPTSSAHHPHMLFKRGSGNSYLPFSCPLPSFSTSASILIRAKDGLIVRKAGSVCLNSYAFAPPRPH